MRKLVTLVFIALSAIVSAKTYYVSPVGGSEVSSGTITLLRLTTEKAFQALRLFDKSPNKILDINNIKL